MTVLAVIPARGGSTRIPRKNMQVVGGMTLVERAWRCATWTGCFSRIVVSTDDDEIEAHARDLGAEVHRRSEACSGDAPILDVLREVVDRKWSKPVVLLEPTCPQRTAEHARGLAVFADTWRRAFTNAATVHDDGHHRWVRNGVGHVFFNWLSMDYPWIALPMGGPNIIDINTPEDLARVRELMG